MKWNKIQLSLLYFLQPPSRFCLIIGIGLLLINMFALTNQHYGFSLNLFKYIYGFFVVGFICYILELIKK